MYVGHTNLHFGFIYELSCVIKFMCICITFWLSIITEKTYKACTDLEGWGWGEGSGLKITENMPQIPLGKLKYPLEPPPTEKYFGSMHARRSPNCIFYDKNIDTDLK